MGVGEAVRRQCADGGRLGRAEARPGVEQVAQAPAGEVLEDEEGPVLLLAPVEDAHQVRVVEGGDGLGLGTEAPQEGAVGAEAGMEELHRHPAVQPGVVGGVDVRGGASAEPGVQPVATREHAADLVGDRRHLNSSASPPPPMLPEMASWLVLRE